MPAYYTEKQFLLENQRQCIRRYNMPQKPNFSGKLWNSNGIYVLLLNLSLRMIVKGIRLFFPL